MTDFNHDPTESRYIDPNEATSFEKAMQTAERMGENSVVGFVVTRHDPFLVLEILDARDGTTLAPLVEDVLSSFGESFMELDDNGMVRVLYNGKLPGNLHGGDPIVVNVSRKGRSHSFRLFDSGWTPLTGRHMLGTPIDIHDICSDALRIFLSKAGKLDD